ncbi:major facilitator superfamily domain-containing protein [Cyathus striatus]|nr:major facilitator superfamily domain-containing protein [Cyathus striatus]
MQTASPNTNGLSRDSKESSSTQQSWLNGLEGSVESQRETKRSVAKSLLLVFTVTFAMIINVANTAAVATALPTIGRDLQAGEAQLQWLVSAYSLSSGCLLVAFGRLADLMDAKKHSYLALCGCSRSQLDVDLRMGVGASATIPAAIGILADAFPPSPARSLAFATFAAGAPIGSVVGNIIGAVFTEYTAGLDFVCIVGGVISMDKDIPSQETNKRVDWIGAFLVTAGLVLIVFVLGIIFLALFILWERYLERFHDRQSEEGRDSSLWHSISTSPPLMKPSLWTRENGKLAATMAVAFFTGVHLWVGFYGYRYLYYQNYKHATAIKTVLYLLPMFFSGLVCNAFVGTMADRIPYIILMIIGTLGTSAACILFSLIDENATYWAFGLPATIISVLGADFVFAGGTLFIAKVSLPHELSVAGALFQTMIQVGTAVGITVSTVVFNRVTKHNGGEISLRSYRAAQWTCFAFGCIAITLAALSFRGCSVVYPYVMKIDERSEFSKRPEAAADEQNQKGIHGPLGSCIGIDSEGLRDEGGVAIADAVLSGLYSERVVVLEKGIEMIRISGTCFQVWNARNRN